MNIYNCFSEKYSVYKGNFNSKLFQNLSEILDDSMDFNKNPNKVSILFFDLEHKAYDEKFIDAPNKFIQYLSQENKQISFISFNNSNFLQESISYHLPYIPNEINIDISNNEYIKKALNIIGCPNITEGCIIFILGEIYIVEYDVFGREGLLTFLDNIYNTVHNIQNYIYNLGNVYINENNDIVDQSHLNFSPPLGGIDTKSILEGLDSDTKVKINEIESYLKNLKDSGQLFLALPILEQMVNDYYKEIDVKDLSPIHIDEEYKILLPKFGNIEVPLSHLTKAIYILFYNHPEGIDLKDLKQHKQELLNLYLNISNQHNYDKMMATIDNLLNDEKAIYPHLSRIKSVFCSVMTVSYAEHYFIIGDREDSSFKYIPMLKTSSKHHLEEDPFEDEDELSEIFKSFKYDFNEEIDDEDLNF